MYAFIYVMIGILCYMFMSSNLGEFDPIVDAIIVILGPIVVFGVTILNVLDMAKLGFDYVIGMFRR